MSENNPYAPKPHAEEVELSVDQIEAQQKADAQEAEKIDDSAVHLDNVAATVGNETIDTKVDAEDLETPEVPDATRDLETPEETVPRGTVHEVLDWVGTDKARAQKALDAEKDGAERVTLISALEDVLNKK